MTIITLTIIISLLNAETIEQVRSYYHSERTSKINSH
jgi:hypothetical protein